MALSDNLNGFWDMDESAGSNASDAISGGNDNTLTQQNSVGSASGMRDLEASSSHGFTLETADDFRYGDENFTWATWVNRESDGTRVIIQMYNGSAGYGFYTVDGALYWFVRGAGGYKEVQWSGSLSTGTLYSVVGWHDATNNVIGISVNGGTAVTTAHTTGLSTTGLFLYFGRNYTSLLWDGLMGPTGTWTSVLDSTDRTAWHNSGTPLKYADIVGGGFSAAWALGCNQLIGF